MNSDRTIYLLLTAVLLCIMVSTFGRSVSIDKRGLVHAMGIDKTDNGYKVSLQIFQPSGGGADTAVDVTRPNVTVAVSEGKTVGEAVSAARSRTGKELFFGHLQLICLGKDMSEDTRDELFAFAAGDKNISPSANICIAENTAEELMRVQLTEEETSAEALMSLLEVSSEYSDTISCDLKELLSEEGDTAIPMLSVTKKDSGDSSEEGSTEVSEAVELSGTAIAGSGTILDEREALAAAMLSGRADKGYTVTKTSAGKVTSSLDSFSVKRTVALTDGKLILKTDIELVAAPDLKMNSEQSRELGDKIAAELENDCIALQKKLLDEGLDIFGTSRLIKHELPKLWLEHNDDRAVLIKSAVPQIQVKVKVV